jgi:hypothetical protein
VTDEFDPFIANLAKELKEPVRLDARLDERIMAALEPEVISIATRRAELPRTPWYRRTFAVPAPLGGLAAAAALAGIAAIGVLATREPSGPQVAVSNTVEMTPVANRSVDRSTELQPTQFILTDPTAKNVVLIGDFNDWDAHATPMVYDTTHGAWSVTIPLLPGLHQYQFLIDGTRHVNDPVAPQMSGDFGSPNSVVTVRIPQP